MIKTIRKPAPASAKNLMYEIFMPLVEISTFSRLYTCNEYFMVFNKGFYNEGKILEINGNVDMSYVNYMTMFLPYYNIYFFMVQQCPNCGVLVGKLHMRCAWCGLYFCEDCIKPSIHYCSAYQERANDAKCLIKKETTVYSTEFYEKFAAPYYLEEEKIPELSEREERDRGRIITKNLISQQHVKPFGTESKSDTDTCSNCGETTKKVDTRCVWCGMYFCGSCAEPEKHNCPVYRYELEEYAKYTKKVELVKTNEQKSVVVPSNNRIIPDTYERSKPLAEFTDNNLGNEEGLKIEVKDKKEITKKKISLWRKLLSMLGFGN